MSIKAARITVDGDKIYQNVEIYQGDELKKFPNFFEDSDFAFRTHQGLFVLPYYNVTIIQLDTVPRNLHQDGIKLVRLSISSDISFHNAKLIPMELYDRYKIPLIFPLTDQFAFCDIQGTWISSDYQVALAQLE
jgi:hypothetical protein